MVNAERVTGVEISDSKGSSELSSQKLECDAVILAVGHSARDTYEMLLSHNVDVVRKDFSVSILQYYHFILSLCIYIVIYI